MNSGFSLGPIARAATFAGLLVVLAGCSLGNPRASLDGGMFPAMVTPVTTQNNELREIPPPDRRVTVAVYDFPDLTGQFKESDTFQTLSRAVTQGGSTILIKALQDAGERRWFSVLDRNSLDNLLKERQIITQMRATYRGETQIDPTVLPPLQAAGIVLEGGIVAYDSNTATGGIGAQYLGIGADAKWTQDIVTVTLRAVSTKTSEVLASVTVNKIIASQALDGNIFRYVELDKILESEAGETTNEPKVVAVQAAVEKAVIALIVEGSELGVWQFADKTAGQQWVDDYRKQKYGSDLTVQAETPPPPATRNAASMMQTVPLPHALPTAAAAPAADAPPPPPAGPNETQG